MGVKASTEPPVTEEEIHLLIDQGTQAGVFEEAEQDIVERVLRNLLSNAIRYTPKHGRVTVRLTEADIRKAGLQPAPAAAPTTKECTFCFTAIPIKAKRCPNCTSELKA